MLLQNWFTDKKRFKQVYFYYDNELYFDNETKAFYELDTDTAGNVIIKQITKESETYDILYNKYLSQVLPNFKNYYIAILKDNDEETAVYESSDPNEIIKVYEGLAIPPEYDTIQLRGTNEDVDTHLDYEVLASR